MVKLVTHLDRHLQAPIAYKQNHSSRLGQFFSCNERSQSGTNSESNAAVEYLRIVFAQWWKCDAQSPELRTPNFSNDTVTLTQVPVEDVPYMRLFQATSHVLG